MKNIIALSVFFFVVLAVNAQYNSNIGMIPLLKTDTTSIGQQLNYPQCNNAEVSIYRITIPIGSSTGWHFHSFPVFAYVEKGELTVQIKDSKTLTFAAGQSFSEVINVYHNGSNNGKEDVILFAVFMGEKNKALSEH